jgi:glycosyltransferase involved in cell wall biosynthesis
MSSKCRVLLFSTSFWQFNGYSSVGYELMKRWSKNDDLEITHWAFQNFYNNNNHKKNRQLPDNIQIYDAYANEKTKSLGFGFDEVTDFVTMNKPDVCIIYNDMVVVTNIINGLIKVPNRKFKIIVYMDQVYLCQKKEAIQVLNQYADFVVTFTPYWEQIAKQQGLTTSTDWVRHGFNPEIYYPVPQKLARLYFNLNQNDFIILNLNRNQPRKRWDLTMMAFAEVVSRHLEDPIKLLIGTSVSGSWNLLEIYEKELRKHGVSLEIGMKHIIMIDNPQQLSDEEINILYNTSDIHISTVDGEGIGLCSLQSAAIGKGQIAPFIGGHRDFLNKDCAILIEPKVQFYQTNQSDGVGGCAEICHHIDFSDAIENYYTNPEMSKVHGKIARDKILKDYKWDDIAQKFSDIIFKVISQNNLLDIKSREIDINKSSNNNKIALSSIEDMDMIKSGNDTAPDNDVLKKSNSNNTGDDIQSLLDRVKQDKTNENTNNENIDKSTDSNNIISSVSNDECFDKNSDDERKKVVNEDSQAKKKKKRKSKKNLKELQSQNNMLTRDEILQFRDKLNLMLG